MLDVARGTSTSPANSAGIAPSGLLVPLAVAVQAEEVVMSNT
jgi:hypothetical protein